MSTFAWETHSTLINRLRIRTPERDSHSVQVRLTAMLNAAELRPPALPPAAILIVRRIGDELPPLRLDWPSARPPLAWQASASKALEAVARRAVRPAAGSSAPDSDSVLFLDRSELLACLASDWLDGALPSRWWWRCLFPGGDPIAALLRCWSESPQYIPAALERMSEMGRAAPFVLRLPGALVPILIRAVLRAFVMPELERAIEPVFGDTLPVSVDLGPAPDSHERVQAPIGEDHVLAHAPPWTPWVREADSPALKPDQRVLIAIALMLQRAPRVIRAPCFTAGLKRWWGAMQRLTDQPARPPAVLVPQPAQPAVDIRDDKLNTIRAESPVEPNTPARMAHLRAPEGIPPPHSAEHRQQETGQAPIPFAPGFRASEERAEEPVAAESIDGGAPSVPSPLVEMATPPEFCLAPAFDGIEIETGFGGVFYLINLAIDLGYYGDFSTPAQPGIDLPLWDFLALAGGELAGQALRDDPVWALMATLAGRSEREEPGHNFEPPLGQSLSAWLGAVMEQVRARLRHALEFDQRDDLETFLLCHPARVQATPTHLDIFLSLDQLPVPIRIARLDRDPGWIPAAGRHIAFHFF